MLSSLPPELIRQIIESTVPSAYHSGTYKDQQRTLSRLFLVSNSFRQIAQPLLRLVIYLRGQRNSIAVFLDDASWKERGQHVRQLVVHGYLVDATLERIVSTFLNLKDFALIDTSSIGVDMNLLSRLTELRDLHLTCNQLSTPPVLLSAVRTLTIWIRRSELAELLIPDLLPSLRSLTFSPSFEISRNELLDLSRYPTFILLLHQLEAFFIPEKLVSEEVLRVLQPFMNRTLILSYDESLTILKRHLPHIQHIRTTFRTPLGLLAKLLEEGHQLSLQSLYLSVSLRPAVSSARLADQPDLQELLAICKIRKVEVYHEEEEETFQRPGDPFMSLAFWRRQREVQNLERAQ